MNTIQIETSAVLPPPLQLAMSVYPAFTLLDLAGPHADLGCRRRTHRAARTLPHDIAPFTLPATSLTPGPHRACSPNVARPDPLSHGQRLPRPPQLRPAHRSEMAGEGGAA
jgi:hypothetical protein